MSAKKEGATLVGIGAAACAACCAGPILGVLAAVGLGTAAGLALFGAAALVLGAVVAGFVVLRRRRRRGRRARVCAVPGASAPAPVPVTLGRAGFSARSVSPARPAGPTSPTT